MVFKRINVVLEGGFKQKLPKMYKVEQRFNPHKVNDILQTIEQEIVRSGLFEGLKNKRIAITAGSRGIKDIDRMTRKVVEMLLKYGAQPFIVPAMGSHGGATAEGQLEMLSSYNITEEAMGVPVLSSMDAVQIATIDTGIPIFCDKFAYESDGIIVMNKIKPHADFKADYESGLVKMMALGLGKHIGATHLHWQGFDSFRDLLPKAGEAFLGNAPVLMGLAIVENAYEEIMHLEVIRPEHILHREKELLIMAKDNTAKIILDSIDVLIVEEIGKNISGEGMDPNVTGRPGSLLKEGFEAPEIQKIVVLDITKESHGNGAGIGMADISTLKCLNKIDLGMMYTNSITATILEPSKIPILMNNDFEAIVLAIKTCVRIDFDNPRVVKIKNTKDLNIIEVSEAYLDDIQRSDQLELVTGPFELLFDDDGYLK